MAYFNNTKDFLVALKGDKGDSPTITAERVEGGVKLTITNPDGSGSIQTVYDGTGGGGSSHGDIDNIKYMRTSADGLIDTYALQFEDGTSYEFQLHNGGKGGGSNIDLDTELKTAGKAADAKAVGDRFEEIDEVIVDMASGGTGYVRNVQTFDGETTMKFFIGTQEEYTALTAEQKEDLFAIITNDSTQEDIAKAIEDVGEILYGTKVAKKAECDQNGKIIDEHYVTRASRQTYRNSSIVDEVIKTGFDNKLQLGILTSGRTLDDLTNISLEISLRTERSETIPFTLFANKTSFSQTDENGDFVKFYFTAPLLPDITKDGAIVREAITRQCVMTAKVYCELEKYLYITFLDCEYLQQIVFLKEDETKFSVANKEYCSLSKGIGTFTIKGVCFWFA